MKYKGVMAVAGSYEKNYAITFSANSESLPRLPAVFAGGLKETAAVCYNTILCNDGILCRSEDIWQRKNRITATTVSRL